MDECGLKRDQFTVKGNSASNHQFSGGYMLVFKGGNIKSLVLVRTFFLSPRAISGVSSDLPNRTVAVGLSTICCNKNLAGFDFQTDQMKRKRRMDSHVLTTEGLYRKIPIAFWFCLGKKGLFSGTPQISIKGDLFFLGSKKKNPESPKSPKCQVECSSSSEGRFLWIQWMGSGVFHQEITRSKLWISVLFVFSFFFLDLWTFYWAKFFFFLRNDYCYLVRKSKFTAKNSD